MPRGRPATGECPVGGFALIPISARLASMKAGRRRTPKVRSPKKGVVRKATAPRSLEDQYQRYFGGDDRSVTVFPDPGTIEPPVLFEIRQFATYGAYEDPI